MKLKWQSAYIRLTQAVFYFRIVDITCTAHNVLVWTSLSPFVSRLRPDFCLQGVHCVLTINMKRAYDHIFGWQRVIDRGANEIVGCQVSSGLNAILLAQKVSFLAKT